MKEWQLDQAPDAPAITIDDLLPGTKHVTLPPEVAAEQLVHLQGAELIAAIEERQERIGGVGYFIREHPVATFEALRNTPDPESHGSVWRRLFWTLGEPSTYHDAPAAIKTALTEAIIELKEPALEEAAIAAASWLESAVTDDHETSLSFFQANQILFLNAWRHPALAYFFPETPASEYGPSHGERLMDDSAGLTAGVVAQVGLLLVDRGRGRAGQFALLKEAEGEIGDTMRSARGHARALIAARLTAEISFSTDALPRATEELVYDRLEAKPPALSLLDLFAKYGRGWTPAVYARLESLAINESKANRLSAGGIEGLVRRLTWMALDRLSGASSLGPEPASMRVVLHQTTDRSRRAAVSTLYNWLQHDSPDNSAQRWRLAGDKFFDQVWPLDASLRSEEISQELSIIPAILGGDDFPLATSKVVPLIKPFQLWTIDSIFRFHGASDVKNRQALALTHWGAAVALIDACLGLAPTTVPHDLADWLDAFKHAPAAQDDPTYRRLSRLVER